MNDLTLQASGRIPTDLGEFQMMAYATDSNELYPHVVLSSLEQEQLKEMKSKPVFVRIHSECMTGDLFHSNRCDCGEQLEASMRLIQEKGGVIIYLRQEGRGIGLINKLKAYNLQDEGADTIKANELLGFGADERTFEPAIAILKSLGVENINLITNNPEKIKAFADTGINVLERVALDIPVKEENEAYLSTKKNVMGHMLKL